MILEQNSLKKESFDDGIGTFLSMKEPRYVCIRMTEIKAQIRLKVKVEMLLVN